MLLQDRGHWRQVATRAENTNQLQQLLTSHTAEEKELIKLLFESYKAKDSKIISAIQAQEYDELPVSMAQWIDDDNYFGQIGKMLYPRVKQMLMDVFHGSYYLTVITGSQRYGKTTLAQCCILRICYELMCQKNPQTAIGLATGSRIDMVNFSVRKDVAQRVIYEGIVSKLELSPWFKKKGFEKRINEIRLPKNIHVLGGESSDLAMLGSNVCGAIMDECVTGDTNIQTPQGSISAQELWNKYRDSDFSICSFDGKAVGNSLGKIKLKHDEEVYEIILDDGKILKASWNHPILVKINKQKYIYKKMIDLKEGDDVVTEDTIVAQPTKYHKFVCKNCGVEGFNIEKKTLYCSNQCHQQTRKKIILCLKF